MATRQSALASSVLSPAGIPADLIALRCALGPILVLLTVGQAPAAALIAVLAAAMLSDIFDGVIARKLGVATAPLRVADSRADAWFFACAALSAWIAAPGAVLQHANLIAASLVLQAGSYVFDLIRYRRIMCLHAYSAKLWGVSLYGTMAALIAFHTAAMLPFAFAVGLVSFLDAAAIKLILPGWRHDVLSAFHALRTARSACVGRRACHTNP